MSTGASEDPGSELRSTVQGTAFAGRVDWLESVDSTNDELWRRAERQGPPLALLAGLQTGGRGRLGRRWSSPGGGLYLSSLLADPGPDSVGLMPFVAALAVAEAIEEVAGLQVDLKWPNDLLVDGAKLGGILTERRPTGGATAVVIGIGVNVAAIDRDGEALADRAITWLDEQVETPISRPRLAGTILRRIDPWYHKLAHGDTASVVPSWCARSSTHVGASVRVHSAGSTLAGVTEGVDPAGALMVRTSVGTTERVLAGSLEIVGAPTRSDGRTGLPRGDTHALGDRRR